MVPMPISAAVGRHGEATRSHYAGSWAPLVLSAVLALLLALKELILAMSTATLCAFATILGILMLLVVIYRAPRGIWSIPAVALGILTLFHLGALPELSFGGKSSLVATQRWITTAEGSLAVWLGLVGVCSASLGTALRTAWPDVERSRTLDRVESEDRRDWLQAFVIVGSAMVTVATAAWLWFLAAYGLGPGSSYLAYLSARQDIPVQLIFDALGVGMALICLAPSLFLSRVAFVAFGIFVVTAFPIGLRGEALFPAATAACLLARGYRMPGRAATVLTATLVLAASAAVSGFRSRGLNQSQVTWSDFSPLSALAELGSSLRVVMAVSSWHVDHGFPLLLGKSYLYPIADGLARYFFLIPYPPEHQKYYLNVLVANREGNVGGSVIGEAFINFGTIGVVTIMVIIGVLLARLDAVSTQRPLASALVGIMIFAFMVHVRNSFSNVPVVIVFAIIALVFAWVMRRILRVRSRK